MIVRTTVSPMAMGKRRHAKQASMWVATEDLPRSAAHPFLQATESDRAVQFHDGLSDFNRKGTHRGRVLVDVRLGLRAQEISPGGDVAQ